MKHFKLVSSLIVSTVATLGCATAPPTAAPTQQQVVDSMIARYAEEATLQLRRLSENTGASRATTASGSSSPTGTSPSSANPSGVTIAGKMGSIAVLPNESNAASEYKPVQRSEPIPSAMAVPEGLEKPLTLSWTGDLESLIFIIGKETGWKVVEPVGLRVTPVVIAINAQAKPAFEVLRDVGAIAGTAADVVISVNNRTIGVSYPKR